MCRRCLACGAADVTVRAGCIAKRNYEGDEHLLFDLLHLIDETVRKIERP